MHSFQRFFLIAVCLGCSCGWTSDHAHREDHALTPTRAGSADNHPGAIIDSGWRRTRDGWEQRAHWYVGNARWQPPQAALFHPVIVAALQLTLSLTCLYCLDNQRETPLATRR